MNDERKNQSRLGAAVALTSRGPRLIMPRGFLRRWHRAALPIASNGEQPLPDVRELVLGLRDERQSVRWRMVEHMRRAGPPPDTLPFLIERLQTDPCRSVRWRAAEALAAPSFPAVAVAKALIEASADRDEWVRWHSHRVLSTAIDHETVLSLLPHAMAATAPATRAYAIEYLGTQRSLPAALLCDIAERLRDENVDVRRRAVEVFIRNPLPARKSAQLGLRLCFEDAEPRLRERAIRAIANQSKRDDALLQSALADPVPAVRAAICEALGDEPTNIRWLRHALHDSDVTVRSSAARALADHGVADWQVAEALANAVAALSPLNTLDLWRSLVASPLAEGVIAAIPARRLHQIIAEDVAADLLPTIGVRLWPANARIRYPNKEGGDLPPIALGYPWVDLGVFRSWETHHPPQCTNVRGLVKQVCFEAVPFAFVHLIPAVEFSKYLPEHFDGGRAPVHIEGYPVASILEGGNSTPDLRRLDLVFANDLRFCQYAVFGGLCSSVERPTRFQSAIGGEWRTFCERMSEILTDADLSEFLQVSWFDPVGWESSRYGRRHERNYTEIREGLERLLRALHSIDGRVLRADIRQVAENYANAVEQALWAQALRRYPEPLLRLLARGAAGERVARFAEESLT